MFDDRKALCTLIYRLVYTVYSQTIDSEEPTTTPLPYVGKPIPSHCVGNQKEFLTASLLSILLGGIGTDRFYLGYVLTGVLKMTIGLTVTLLTILRVVYSFLVDTKKLQAPFSRMWLSFVFFVFVCSAMQFVLWLTDVIIIMAGGIADANGCPLA